MPLPHPKSVLASVSTGLVGLALALVAQAPAWAQVKIGVITSATGPVATVGISQKNAVALLPKKVGDATIDYVYFDDASDPTQSVALTKKLLDEQHVDAIIGPSGSPHSLAMVQFVADAQTPMLAPVGTVSVVLPMDDKKKWVFKTTQNDNLICDALVGHMKKVGVKTAAFIGFSDAYGESWHQEFTAQAAAAGIKVVADERYARSDASVTAQSLKILSAAPDAVLVAGVGTAAVLPQATLYDQGYKGRIYQTHGAATPDFFRIGGSKVEGTVLAASLMLVLPEIPDSNPSKKIAQGFIDGYVKLYGQPPATFGANVYDAGLLLERAIPQALKKGKPGTVAFRAGLRDALEGTRDLVATQGVYNMSPQDHSGFDDRGRVLIVVKDGAWKLLKD
ncbi:MAG: ABC transporter substrate-binding protein [Proteobacteria bacterium]|nr:ABC transporter substrate-binding protein [Pseudomonadota bacterium]